jgi:hypothetical protein
MIEYEYYRRRKPKHNPWDYVALIILIISGVYYLDAITKWLGG